MAQTPAFFDMDIVTRAEKVARTDLAAAKQIAFEAIKSLPDAKRENINKANNMVTNARSNTQLIIGMSNFLLSHDGLKVIK